ncbi:DNA-directed RNA polymerase subunit alpha [Candidatus Phytoplasma melaleucae]|uniref:DNA-directed RNA polymerase subunit alpha n=1 Tax=Candidatus Phytoplasma melaleucae TaxID=2982630 RepID=A0ABT9DFE6_9MOLU|nr:DNA-directed RNA polymerase subunit alpha ['Melaleuca sp.' phytoplasma]MDO8168101.1 DNA-directed RNA polymerase subunit alpha ['Melaleuca sp.' phytoplasma]MDV3205271.1 DNA-directed RNA polymerase subunit alpha [Weeping tea tree witches'-broom phytoplasma]
MKKLQFLKPIMIIQEENTNSHYGKFVIQCLQSSHANTLGNSIRRILLSSLPGAAIVNIRIEGFDHEFNVIQGVYEDIMSIVLNLKKVVISVNNSIDDFEEKLEINVVGPKVITAADFQSVPGVTIINKEHVIAHLSKNTHFKMIATVRKGIGYCSAEENKIYNQGRFGLIAIDSLYTPVVKTSYHVEQKLGKKEELVIEIETNGAITAKKALSLAAKILVDHLNVLVNLCEETKKIDFIYEPKIESHNHALDFKIEQLELSVRLLNSLKKSGIHTVKELVIQQEKDIMKLNSLGKKSFEELKEKMNALDLHFNMKIDEK